MRVGLTTCDPSKLAAVPSSCSGLPSHTWVMTGSSFLVDGQVVLESYGRSLSRLQVMGGEGRRNLNKSDKKNFGSAVRLPQTGDTIGVQRSAEGALHVHINDVDLGPAVYGIPEVWELNFSCTLYVASSQPSWLLHSEVMRSVGAFGRVELAEIFGSFKTAVVYWQTTE